MKRLSLIFSALICSLCAIDFSAAQQPAGPSPAETKLKEALKTSMAQTRTLQGERDTALAEKQALETELKKLKSDMAERAKDEEVARQKAKNEIEDLTNKNADTQKNLDQHKSALAKWQEGFRKMEGMRDTTESKRAALASQVVVMQRRIDDQQAKNREMHKLATEILERYENFGLGRALLAREPFTGLAKVKLQTFVQDFGDKLADQQINPEAKPGAAATSTAATAKPKADKAEKQ